MKKELIKSLQHFALIIKLYKCDIDAKCKFLKTYLALLSFPMKDIITKKTAQVRRCHLQIQQRKQKSLKVYNILH